MTMPSSPTGGTKDRTGRFVRQPNGHVTPLSPYTDIWRWHVTMAASILFRATIIAATVGAVILAVWLGALAFGPEHFDCLSGLAGSPLGLFVFFGLTVVAFSFVLNGARHLINDSGHGLTLKPANLLANIAVWAPVPLAIVFWVILFATGRVSL